MYKVLVYIETNDGVLYENEQDAIEAAAMAEHDSMVLAAHVEEV